MRTHYGWLGCLTMLLCALPAFAQPPRPSGSGVPPVRRTLVSSPDEQLAAVMYTCCRNEIELAQFAEKRLKTVAGREFAKMLIEHHQAACDKLQKLAGDTLAERAVIATAVEKAPGIEKPSDKPIAKPEAQPAFSPARQLDWVMIHQQIADHCLKSTKEELSRYEGDDFDKAFIGQQLAAHLKMSDELKVFEDYASDSLRGQVKAAQEMTAAHLKQARAIMDSQTRGADKRGVTKSK